MKRRNKFASSLVMAFLLACGVARAQRDSPMEQQPASVSGVVSNSLTGEPLAHARVIMASDTGAQACSLPDSTCRYGLTAADGRFSIAAIAPGKYEMVVERRGYGPLADEQENRKSLLKPGDEIKDVALQLVPDAVISGRVLDAKGVSMERVFVEAVGGGSPRFAVTDDHGEFRIGGLRAGRYLVKTAPMSESDLGPPEIRTDGTAELNYIPTYYPSSPNAKSATPVEARAGEETGGVDIKLAPAPILRVSGAALPEDRVFEVWLSRGHTEARRKMIEPDGAFTFWRVPPGRYQVFTEFCSWEGVRVHSGPVEINVTDSSVEGIRVLCAQPLELEGHVEVEGGAAMPEQKDHTPSLKLFPVGSIDDAEQEELITADGTFKIGNVFPGRYHLIVENLPQNFYVKSAHIGTADLQNSVLDLRNVDPKAVMTVQLGTNGAEVSGVVHDMKGPAAGTRVALFFDDAYGFDLAGKTSAAADGTYVLHGIAPGKYKLVAYDPKSSAVMWSGDAMALHAAVTEDIDAQEGDKIVRDLRVLR